MSVMGKKICAALSAILCVALLGGCSEEVPANVYLPGELDMFRPSSSTSSSTVKDEGQYDGFLRPSTSSSSSSSSRNPVVTTPNTPTDVDTDFSYRGKWYYNTLSDKCKRVYARLYSCSKNNIQDVDVSDLDVSYQDVYEAYWAFDYENPQFLELGSGYELTMVDPKISNRVKRIKFQYGRLPSENLQTALETRAETILEAAREQGSDYEKLKYIHDWIVENTTYSKTGEEYESEADGPIVYGQALCEGYSKAFMYLAQQLGYPCICSVGVANLEDHMWNMVKIGPRWYNVDVTWDDPDNPDDTNEGTKLRHDYFLICDAEIRLDHRVIRPVMLPTSDYGYFPHGFSIDNEQSTADSGQRTVDSGQ